MFPLLRWPVMGQVANGGMGMDRRVLEAMRLMERRMGDELPVEQVAATLGLSLHHFHRQFVEGTGEPPAAFLRRIRMDAAALRLKWADEPTEALAQALGFRSRPAFVRAFTRQFGVPPARYRKEYRAAAELTGSVGGRPVTLREVDSFRLLAKRYVGDISRMRTYWRDLHACLPADMARPGSVLHIGLLHDDPRVTDPCKVRYDCCITVDASVQDRDGLLAARGLHLLESEPGRYAMIRHRGAVEAIPATYDAACHSWVIPNGYVPGHNPAIEIHTVPRHLQDPLNLDFTILFPIE